MAKPKQFTRAPKKQNPKSTEPRTADDYQEAADFEEETGGKWRAGDPAKSGRAFVRALEIYNQGLQKHPASFDLAYNKARLELEITQRPALVSHIGLPLVDLLRQTLESHRYALRLNEGNPDALFNTSQVLTSLAEQLSEAGETGTAIPLLQEALELLSACCSRQEMLLEQQQADFAEVEEGGVALEHMEEQPASTPGSEDSGQMATIENPVTAVDLLDTVHASLSALTTLVALVEHHALDSLGDMAHSLTETKAPMYIKMLSEGARESASFTVALDRANFVAAFADAQFSAYLVESSDYQTRLEDVFSIPNKDQHVTALTSEAEARTEFTLSVLTRYIRSPDFPVEVCWKQLKLAQDLYTKALKLESSPQIYLSRGDVEMLRHRIATLSNVKVSESVRRSAPTLAQNAQTYYKGAFRLAADEDGEVREKAGRRLAVSGRLRALLYGVELESAGARDKVLNRALEECVEEGLLDADLAEAAMGK
ncbi:hypothetical protein LTR91_003909 [Friedmanniomyces endolithicus]|uniref:Uncharacterized protein n=1 Tax=Friedmanniomyces endolithicus TaxID=329885 RepID=A0AAN6KWR8_9PEZI|nr:hypothetical protein LTR82_005901 [Friedmanniomyces endolithicus]KAK0826971.1 hypothetical protein LTR73_005752 [Friedmanniomyces endolithicus]KAK0927285.1 hypothetical protein LTR57_003446 [Friedmanniomyces endolithicus]KAK0995869.1 hypothetical protein LTS01_006566 [Friedmanniomyces endolithicus]KAK1005982.1 hypothetical protein LTR91_003909 [Friedmanniomyces endolithicus]